MSVVVIVSERVESSKASSDKYTLLVANNGRSYLCLYSKVSMYGLDVV